MLHLPLLSDAYAAALFEVDGPRPKAPIETPCKPSDDADAERDDLAEATATEDAAPDDEDDMETARTRPLRLDQIHL